MAPPFCDEEHVLKVEFLTVIVALVEVKEIAPPSLIDEHKVNVKPESVIVPDDGAK